MKIAVLSDIHGNYPALETVVDHVEQWRPDQVFVAGDIVNRGPRSLNCLELLLDKHQNQGWKMILGNHEEYVLNMANPDPEKPINHPDLDQFVMYTARQIKSGLKSLAELPDRHSNSTTGFGEIRMVHASMLHNRDGIYPETNDIDLRKKIAPPPTVLIVGHTHRSFIRRMDGTLVVNAGSTGLPFDGDRRAGYAQVELQGGDWQAKIIRMNYDIKKAERDFYDSGYLDGAGPLANLVLLELKTALSQLYQWSSKFLQPILSGKITVGEATELFLSKPIIHPYW